MVLGGVFGGAGMGKQHSLRCWSLLKAVVWPRTDVLRAGEQTSGARNQIALLVVYDVGLHHFESKACEGTQTLQNGGWIQATFVSCPLRGVEEWLRTANDDSTALCGLVFTLFRSPPWL